MLRVVRRDDGWFMDYRNADGSVSEMCGNGIRVFARYLVDEGLATSPVDVDTRDGVKTLTVDGDLITVDMGTPKLLGDTTVAAEGITWAARHVDMGNPHAVAFVGSLDEAGPLLDAPTHDPAVYPEGVNVEFVVRRAERHIAMRVHERGSGETRSCGTGACAAMVAAAAGEREAGSRPDLPGRRAGRDAAGHLDRRRPGAAHRARGHRGARDDRALSTTASTSTTSSGHEPGNRNTSSTPSHTDSVMTTVSSTARELHHAVRPSASWVASPAPVR